jgi:hypothetical protein
MSFLHCPKKLFMLLLIFGAVRVYAAPYYFHDFQWDIGANVPGWSAGTIQSAPNPDYGGWRRFLGEFGNETTNLTLSSLPTHDLVTLSFDLYLLRSWDGEASDYGPDRFGIDADSSRLFLKSFSNGHPAGQSFCPDSISQPCAPMTGASERYSLGYSFSEWVPGSGKTGPEIMDAVYHFDLSFSHSASNLVLSFFGEGLQGMTSSGYLDEAWGLDNVAVYLHTIPEPPTAILLSLTLLLFGFSKILRVPTNQIVHCWKR